MIDDDPVAFEREAVLGEAVPGPRLLATVSGAEPDVANDQVVAGQLSLVAADLSVIASTIDLGRKDKAFCASLP